MTFAEACVRTLFCGAALSAVFLARPSLVPSHRVVAVVLCLAFACDVLRPFLPLPLRRSFFLLCLPRPNKDHLWGAGVFLYALWVFGSAWFVFQNLPARDPYAVHVQGMVRLCATIIELVLVAIFALQRRVPTTSETVVLLLIAGDVGELVGPWAVREVWGAWELAQWQWTIVYCVVCMVQILRARWVNRQFRPVLGFSGSA